MTSLGVIAQTQSLPQGKAPLFTPSAHAARLETKITGLMTPLSLNTRDAVVDHLTAQTAASGAGNVPPDTRLSADGTSIRAPTDTQKTREGQFQQYKTFGPVFGLPSLPEGAQFVPPRLLDALTHTIQGYALDGTPVNHDILPQRIAAMQSRGGVMNGPASTSSITRRLTAAVQCG